VVWLGFEEDCILTSCKIGECCHHVSSPQAPFPATKLRTFHLQHCDKACGRATHTKNPRSMPQTDPLLAFVELMHFLMLIRKWIADFFSRRPHQNVGPTEGRRDQRRQRSVDDVDKQPVIIGRGRRWDPCLLQRVSMYKLGFSCMAVRMETWWWCVYLDQSLCLQFCTRVVPMRASYARHACCFQQPASALYTFPRVRTLQTETDGMRREGEGVSLFLFCFRSGSGLRSASCAASEAR
jgi:hypothetical protein